MRRGELLGLCWPEVHLTERNTAGAVEPHRRRQQPPPPGSPQDQGGPQLGQPVCSGRRRAGAAGVGRAVEPAGGNAARRARVFCQPDGAPLRPQQLLVTLRRRSAEIGLPRIGVHDLQHTAASIMISSEVPLAVVSGTLRHSTLSTTVNIYGHLRPARRARCCHRPVPGARRRLAAFRRPRQRSVRPSGHRVAGRTSPGPCARPSRRHHRSPEREQRACRFGQTRWSHTSGRQDLNLRPLDPQRSKGCPTGVQRSESRRSGPTSFATHDA
ncbi:tyrosine-type recombinase/integrase [Kitasatospora sp. A2-31]|uniref:tyrosine-type recombinase/integrase n=1 Tax=Kitasatospora sp. A2-31 TaxID=2916414 RepID=UPI0035ABE557